MNNDNVIPIGVNIYKRQIAEKKSKTKPPIKPKFKIVLTEEEKKAKEEKIKAKNKMAEEDMLSFFEGKKSLKMNEFIQGQIKDRNVDNTIRIFLFSSDCNICFYFIRFIRFKNCLRKFQFKIVCFNERLWVANSIKHSYIIINLG